MMFAGPSMLSAVGPQESQGRWRESCGDGELLSDAEDGGGDRTVCDEAGCASSDRRIHPWFLYNPVRLRSSLGDWSPNEYAQITTRRSRAT